MPGSEEIATTYYNALYSRDFDRVAEMTSPGLVFEDPTAPPELGIPAELNGAEAVIDYFRTNLPKLDVEMTITNSYASNDWVVLQLDAEGETAAATFGQDGDRIAFRLQGTTLVHVADGLVVRHSDYFDYTGLFSSLRPAG